jgi:flagellar motor switch protein FliG
VDFESLSGPEKVAIVMLSLPQSKVRDLFAQLEDDEVEKALAAISRMDAIPSRVQKQVLAEFEEAAGKAREDGLQGGRKQALALLQHVNGDERASKILENLGRDEQRIDWTLRAFQPEYIAERIASEHPQTIALTLSQLPAPRGAKIIEALPEELRSDVVLRLANLDSVSNDVMAGLEVGVAELFDRRPVPTTRVGGPKTAALMLNRVAKQAGATILEEVGAKDSDTALSIRKRMLSFDDLTGVDKRGFQALLREVNTQSLAVALKAASEEMRAKVYSNLSTRAAEQIQEEIELLGPMRLSEVERVQEEIVETARRLEGEGRLTLDQGGGGDDVLV